MKPLSYSYILALLLAPAATTAAAEAKASDPLTTDTLLSPTVSPTNPGGPILTFTSTSVTDTSAATTGSAASSTTDSSLSSESTTTSALHPSEPTGVSGATGTATGTGASATASATSTASEGAAAFGDGGSSRVALVVALGAGLLGYVAF